jgi:pimeloyl-ACP methyl ester carboxylesterase
MIKEKTFETDELSINYAESPDNGPPLVLLHGTANRWQSFLPIIPALIDRWHIYAPDFRGHGKSGRTIRYGFENYTKDVVNLLEVAINSPAILFGHSLGGRVALKLADTKSPLVKAIILGDSSLSTPKRMGGMSTGFSQLLELINENNSVHDIYKALLQKEGEEYNHTSVLSRAKNLSMVDPMVLRSILDHPDPDDPESHFNGYYPETHLRNVRCPTLIIQAEKGMLGNQEIQKALNILPEAYHITLKGAHHEFLTWESEPVIKALNAFLEAII